nr:immunoglobulin heavy chain junction region [Macaca mulatta]MOV42034.1 immunoglobulin heavy chain junction region [Macaca mulatta]MOV46316.1 immunoglobulin heavy chain junction region [Macaca mulatta]
CARVDYSGSYYFLRFDVW